MPSYNAVHFNPPAPAALVTIRNPDNGQLDLDVPVLMDSGADVTLLPRTAIEQLGIPVISHQQYELVGFDGSKSFAPVVTLEVIFLKRTFQGKFLLIDEENGILGRDVLNPLSLVLDGPRQQWWEHSP
jgi:predicted aspartyl protease